MTLKAYKVESGDEDGHCAIVFAHNNASARHKGASEFGIYWEELESCRRAPEFDGYAGAGDVPPMVLMEHGWWFECGHCSQQVSNDSHDYDEDREHAPVADAKGNVYCSPEHMALDFVYWRKVRAQEAAAVEAALLTWPGITKVSGGMWSRCRPEYGESLQASFAFPGGQWGVNWTVGEDTVLVCKEDVDAWNAFKVTCYGAPV